jgi:hypothetical protein
LALNVHEEAHAGHSAIWQKNEVAEKLVEKSNGMMVSYFCFSIIGQP